MEVALLKIACLEPELFSNITAFLHDSTYKLSIVARVYLVLQDLSLSNRIYLVIDDGSLKLMQLQTWVLLLKLFICLNIGMCMLLNFATSLYLFNCKLDRIFFNSCV